MELLDDSRTISVGTPETVAILKRPNDVRTIQVVAKGANSITISLIYRGAATPVPVRDAIGGTAVSISGEAVDIDVAGVLGIIYTATGGDVEVNTLALEQTR